MDWLGDDSKCGAPFLVLHKSGATPLIPSLGRWRQEDQNFKGILSKFDVSLAGRDPFSKGFVVLMCF